MDGGDRWAGTANRTATRPVSLSAAKSWHRSSTHPSAEDNSGICDPDRYFQDKDHLALGEGEER